MKTHHALFSLYKHRFSLLVWDVDFLKQKLSSIMWKSIIKEFSPSTWSKFMPFPRLFYQHLYFEQINKSIPCLIIYFSLALQLIRLIFSFQVKRLQTKFPISLHWYIMIFNLMWLIFDMMCQTSNKTIPMLSWTDSREYKTQTLASIGTIHWWE